MDVLGPYVCMAAGVIAFLAIGVILAHAAARDDRHRRRAGAAAARWSPDDVWQPFGRTVVVAGRRIPGGLLYVGPYLIDAQGRLPEPALINPGLPVARRAAPPTLDIGYWPSYTRLRPEQRATYLDWLAGGRTRPSIATGYVWLYFYGLERRLLSGMRDLAESRGERARLVREVQRLRSLYGGDAAFAGYAARLLDCMEVLDLGEPSAAPAPKEHLPADESLLLRYALGRLAADGHPVPWDWALAWFLAHPEASGRGSARVCPEEFRALFRIRYGEAHGPGLTIAPAKRTFAVRYKPASPSFGGLVVDAPLGKVPDVARLKRLFRRIAVTAEACHGALASYSAWLQLHPTGRGTDEARALLPGALGGYAAETAARLPASPRGENTARLAGEALGPPPLQDTLRRPRPARGSHADTPRGPGRPSAPDVPIAQLSPADRDRLLGELVPGHQPGHFWRIQVDQAFQALGCANPQAATNAQAAAVADLLEGMGLGMEPDPRFGDRRLAAGDTAVLFHLPPGSPSAPSRAYARAALELHLLLVVAKADWHICDRERAYIVEKLRSNTALSRAERTRLTAHSAWLLELGPGLDRLNPTVPRSSLAEARALGRLLVGIAAADGRVSDAELRALRRLYPVLGMAPLEVDVDVKAVAAAGEAHVEGAGFPPPESTRRTATTVSALATLPPGGADDVGAASRRVDRAAAERFTAIADADAEPTGYALPEPFAVQREVPGTTREPPDAATAADAARAALRQELASGREPGDVWTSPAERVLRALAGMRPPGPSGVGPTALPELLQAVGLGMEPDPRFGGLESEAADDLVLFLLPLESPSAPSAAYAAAALELRLLVEVAKADWRICEREAEFIGACVGSREELTQPERTRLVAHWAWIRGPGAGAALHSARPARPPWSADAACAVGKLLAAAAADGRVSDTEYRVLRQQYERIGLGPGDLDADLRAIAATGQATVEVAGFPQPESTTRTAPDRAADVGTAAVRADPAAAERSAAALGAQDGSDRYALPEPLAVQPGLPSARVAEPSRGVAPPSTAPSPRTPGAAPRDAYRSLDMERVRSIVDEDGSSAVWSDLLGEEEELGAWAAEDESRADRTQTVAGLDQPHSDLVRALADRAHMARAEFGRIAEGLGLLPDGALHTINDAAYDKCDDILIEGDDELTIVREVLGRMLA